MANLENRVYSGRAIETCCKCSKTDIKMEKHQCDPYLETAVTKFAERRGDLMNRQQHLMKKISTMERCIPALMAFNMWTSGRNCDDPPLCKVRQIMNRLSPNSDPTEKLVEKLKNTVKNLNMETAELHEKIIAADIALEESGMELESIAMANEEYEKKVKSLEKELKLHGTPSLHSINSDDLICLTKIRKLGEEQVNLKNGIRELEEREAMFHEQMNRLLTSKEFRKSSRGSVTNKKKRDIDCNEIKMHRKKKSTEKETKFVETEDPKEPSTSAKVKNEEKTKSDVLSRRMSRKNTETNYSRTCSCTSSAAIACYDKFSCPKMCASSKSQSSRTSLGFCDDCMKNCSRNSQRLRLPGGSRSVKSCGLPLVSKSNMLRGQACASCSKSSTINYSGLKSESRNSSRRRIASPCELDSSCRKCRGFVPCEECLEETINSCRCSCKGKCAIGESDVPCNCAEYLNSTDDEGYQPDGDTAKINDQSSSDEYCDCCDCGCEESDEESDSCQC